jgi:polyisoprenoid-binding protein YceI
MKALFGAQPIAPGGAGGRLVRSDTSIMKKTILTSLSALLITHAALASDIYVFDKDHSTVGFLVHHLFSKVSGKFTDFSGQISLGEADPEQSTVEVTIKTASVNTSNDMRDQDLKSPNFFDVNKFPEMTFKSKSVKRTGQNTADVTGDLTLHGVTKEAVLKVELLGKGAGPQGTTVSGWDATTTLKRSDFGLAWNKMIEGTHVVGDDVQVEIHVEADKQ